MNDTMSVIVAASEPAKGIFGNPSGYAVQLSAERLREGLLEVIEGIRSISSGLNENMGGLVLSELEAGVEISAEGGISLIGTAKAGGHASIKLTFKFGERP